MSWSSTTIPTLRGILVDYLSQHALKVTGLSGSRDLQRILNTEPVDLFIIDLNLGREDGWISSSGWQARRMARSSS